MKLAVAIGCLALALQLTACGSSSESATSVHEPGQEAATGGSPFGPEGEKWLREATAADDETRRDDRWTDLKKAAGAQADRLVYPNGEPPEEVLFKDLRIGRGPVVEENDLFGARYQAFNYRTGSLAVQSNLAKPQYHLGIGELIGGWDQGLKGIRKGGVRELILPSNWAYGTGALVYVVRITALEK